MSTECMRVASAKVKPPFEFSFFKLCRCLAATVVPMAEKLAKNCILQGEETPTAARQDSLITIAGEVKTVSAAVSGSAPDVRDVTGTMGKEGRVEVVMSLTA